MNLEFHHIGVACRDLDSEADKFTCLGYCAEGEDFLDPVQGVRGRFLVGGGPRMELLVNINDVGVLTPWLKAGVKFYHIAYETVRFDDDIKGMIALRGKIAVGPVPAVAFGGRRIVFIMMPNLTLVELIET
jgi:methylmalonyl-CoA/ethylmalonyl-CoA epimerase